MIFRPQRGELVESMKEAVELSPTRKALAAHLNVEPGALALRLYDGMPDYRIDWQATYLVTVWGQAVGFTNNWWNE